MKTINFRDTFTIYFIRPKGMPGPIKIGLSSKVDQRAEALSVWSPWPLEIIGTVPGTWADEQYLHSCFHDHRSHGEWFKETPELISAVAEVIAAGHVDRAKLHPQTDNPRRRKPRAA